MVTGYPETRPVVSGDRWPRERGYMTGDDTLPPFAFSPRPRYFGRYVRLDTRACEFLA
jgi:hypothetical protein